MFRLDFGDHRPLYEQIKDKIKELIISGALKEGNKIPSVRELAAVLAINPNTIQKAYKDLETEGYIYSQRAKGSFVSPKSEAAAAEKTEKLYEKLDEVIKEMAYLKIDLAKINERVDKTYKGV